MVKESTTEKITRRAYEIYEARGGENGQDLDDWFQAEKEVLTELGSDKKQSSTTKTKKRR